MSHRVCNSVLTASGERIQLLKLLPDQLIKPSRAGGGARTLTARSGRTEARPGFLRGGVMCSCTSPGSRPGQDGWSLGAEGWVKNIHFYYPDMWMLSAVVSLSSLR